MYADLQMGHTTKFVSQFRDLSRFVLHVENQIQENKWRPNTQYCSAVLSGQEIVTRKSAWKSFFGVQTFYYRRANLQFL